MLNEKHIVYTFDELIDYLQKKLKFKVTYKIEGDGYTEFEYKGELYKLMTSWEGMQYYLKLLDETGTKIIELPQRKWMDKDGNIIADDILKYVKANLYK